MRHASPDNNFMGKDVDKPLSNQGLKECMVMKKFLLKQEMNIDLVLCSSSVRTKQTYSYISQCFFSHKAILTDELYLAPAKTIAEMLKNVPEKFNNIFLIGHNMGVLDFCDEYTDYDTYLMNRNIFYKFMPASIACFEIYGDKLPNLKKESLKLNYFKCPDDFI